MAPPKVYGTPTGYEPPKQNVQRPKASSPAQQQQEGKDYLQHMINAHNTYHSNNPQQQVQRPRGSSSTAKPSPTRGIPRVDKAVKDAGG